MPESGRLRTFAMGATGVSIIVLMIRVQGGASREPHKRSSCSQPPQSAPKGPKIYLGNGCFWERQWAYVNVEMHQFQRPAPNVTSYVGYAGGRAPPASDWVCYHTNDEHDYERLGHAEVVQVELDEKVAVEQAAALAADFFASFEGPDGSRSRPDPQDVGSPYRSLIGLPGGTASPLYGVFERANVHGMALRPSAEGAEPDSFNAVFVMDSTRFPFWPGEVYHQMHCNFFYSEGMPYPKTYYDTLWHRLQDACVIAPTGCPEDHPLTPHPGQLCAGWYG